jgi:hypothetical protein
VAKSEVLQIRLTKREKQAVAAHARRAGQDMSSWVLERLFPPGQQAFQETVRALQQADQKSYVWADLHDWLVGLSPGEFKLAVSERPDVSLDEYDANYLAAMVEMAASMKRCLPPPWVKRIAPLDRPRFASTLKSLRLYLLFASPPPFRRRNIFVDATLGARV